MTLAAGILPQSTTLQILCKLIFTNSSGAVTKEHLKTASVNDANYQAKLGLTSKGKKLPTRNIYGHIQNEMTVADHLLLKGNKILVFKGEHKPFPHRFQAANSPNRPPGEHRRHDFFQAGVTTVSQHIQLLATIGKCIMSDSA